MMLNLNNETIYDNFEIVCAGQVCERVRGQCVRARELCDTEWFLVDGRKLKTDCQ